jgi:hypothetical protein
MVVSRGGRIALLAVSVLLLVTLGIVLAVERPGPAPSVAVLDNRPIRPVPARYLGLSVESANLCRVVQLARTDPAFVRLIQNLGPGVFRVGGNTGDRHASWTVAGRPRCAWHSLVVTPALVRAFFAFARSVGWRVLWQVPLANGAYAQDAAEAAYVARMPDLDGVEFGDEPNFYRGARTQRDALIASWNTIYRDYRADGGAAPVTGPSTWPQARWYTSAFLDRDARRVSSLAEHWYVAKATTDPTCTSLLAATGARAVATADAQARAFGLPLVMEETNTYTHFGKRGVSNAFCSALWAADYSLVGLSEGASGMYFHGTADFPPGNSLGRVQYYTPIDDDGAPAPEYYGLLFVHQLLRTGGEQVAATAGHASGVDPYAVLGPDGTLRLALVNRTGASVALTVRTRHRYARASELALSAPSVSALSGVVLGGAGVAGDGSWAGRTRPVGVGGRSSTVTVRPYSALLVTYRRR